MAALLLAIGCGGGGSAQGSPTAQTRSRVQQILGSGAKIGSGGNLAGARGPELSNDHGTSIFFGTAPVGAGGGTTGGGFGYGGWGPGWGWAGGFGFAKGGDATGGEPGGSSGGSSGTTGSGGGEEPPMPPIWGGGFYYNDWLQLWVEDTYDERSYQEHYFVDEAKTQPAGFLYSSFDFSGLNSGTQFEYSITAGPMSGSNGKVVYENTGSRHTWTSNFFDSVENVRSSGMMAYNDDGSGENHSQLLFGDGTSMTTDSQFRSDGSFSMSCTDQEGISTVQNFNPDGSGNGTITGQREGLPASMQWDTMGHGTITWANGTVDEFWMWGIISEDPGDGTTGVGTSGSTGGVPVPGGPEKPH